MPMTLLEAAKLNGATDVKSSIIELYARSSDILTILPFMNIGGNAYQYNREETLPGVGFRGVNEGYTESIGVINPVTESLTIAGGDLDVDKFILQTHGEGVRAQHEAMKLKAMALRWTKALVKGDNSSDPKEFTGLQGRITGDQLISAGSTSGGAALSLAKLDELIDQVDNPTHLLMNKTLARLLSGSTRDTGVSGYITHDIDDLGRRVTSYNGIPIVIIDKDNEDVDILAFNETAASGSATATSLYAVSIGDDGLMGIQNGGMEVTDLGELDSKPVERTRIEWYASIALQKGRAAARLRHIGNLAVTA